MRTPRRQLTSFLLAALAALLLAGCTVQLNGPSGKGKVTVSAQRSTGGRALEAASLLRSGTKPTASTLQLLTRATSRAGARDLSASTDIEAMRYVVSNLNPGSGEGSMEGDIDPSYPYLELYLTPGESYRISVEVVPTASAPGHNTGISYWGDFADVTVPTDGSSSFVWLSVHPTGTAILEPALPGYVYDSFTGDHNYVSGLFSGNPPLNPMDKGFYGPDGRLYFLSVGGNGLYVWDDANPPAAPTKTATPDYLGTPDSITIKAAVADQTLPGTVWLLAVNNTDQSVWIYYLDTSASPAIAPTAFPWVDITPQVTYAATTFVTGLAIDTMWNFYVTFNPHDATASFGGVLKLDMSGNALAEYPSGLQPGDQYFTDVAYQGGRVHVLTSPIFNIDGQSYGGIVAPGMNQGTPSALELDTELNFLGGWQNTFSNSPSSNVLWAPVRILGFNQDRVMFIGQRPWTGGSPNSLTAPPDYSIILDMDTGNSAALVIPAS